MFAWWQRQQMPPQCEQPSLARILDLGPRLPKKSHTELVKLVDEKARATQ